MLEKDNLLRCLCFLLVTFGCGGPKSSNAPPPAAPTVVTPASGGNRAELEQLRKERDDARKQRIEAEDFLKEYEIFKKEEAASKKAAQAQGEFIATGRRTGDFYAPANSPLWKTTDPDGKAKMMEQQKLRAERKLEELEYKIRDLER